MNEQDKIDYIRIAEAIEYIKTNFRDQPKLDDVAEIVHLSPFHFQRLFTEWAGVSPKKFLQYITIEHAKSLLKENQATLFETSNEIGLSGTSRLHDLFISLEGMTPADYKNGGKNLIIHYQFYECLFGKIIIGSTSKGICYMAFVDEKEKGFNLLQQHFPNAKFIQSENEQHQNALLVFNKDWTNLNPIKLHLKGTEFQIKVWETLLKIPMGKLSTYGNIANSINNPNASRAVGTAIGSNPVAYLIPCHRVIQSSGIFGGYMWGNTRKTAIIGWEQSNLISTSSS